MGLDGVEIVMWVEKDFGVKICDAEVNQSRRVSDLCDVILEHLLAEPSRLPDHLKRLVFLHVQTIVSEQMGIGRSNVKPESRFVEDLKVN
jgi:acyl carrier protein